ncbi:MAG TPA: hypothetical protein ENH10_06055 [Bacteroidetes bacterium]|nr:hypothetical protein [Bacteroidota bacterium]HEX04707.1 hypothetical protein [Bacteroidota bacterium]
MSATIASRVIRSSPYQDSAGTWNIIVDLITRGIDGPARSELLAVSGIAGSIIADQSPKDAAIVVTCDGPRTRIYCLYDDDAIEGSDAKEDAFGFDPLQGNWAVSLPCADEDLAWVQRALKAKSARITARDKSSTLGDSGEDAKKAQAFTVNIKEFLDS